VAPPKQIEHERLASDYLTDDVARIYTFGGSRVLDAANDTLEEVVARMADEPVARHAHLMLGRPAARPHKLLELPGGAARPEPVHVLGGAIAVKKAEPKVAEEHLHAALDDAPVAAETLGHIRFNRAVDRFATVLEEQGETAVAAAIVGQAQRALSARGVLDSVVEDLAERKRRLEAAGGKRARSSGSKGSSSRAKGTGRTTRSGPGRKAAAKSGR
jgi:hypothetical protein